MNHARIPKWQGVRGTRWVYANYYEQRAAEGNGPFEFLHDLSVDPLELKNLAADPAFADQLDAMRARSTELERTWRSGNGGESGGPGT